MTNEEKQSALFGGLIMMFHAAAMQQMGKVKNPISDKIERDLEQAQVSIDMLDVIMSKTKGNLTTEEERFINTMLQELKINYVEEVNKEKKESVPKEKGAL